MDALIDTIVSKLRRLSVSKLQAILEFVSFLDWQESQLDTDPGAISENALISNLSESDRQADWSAFIQECAGAFPDFPTLEEIRKDMGEDVAREQF